MTSNSPRRPIPSRS